MKRIIPTAAAAILVATTMLAPVQSFARPHERVVQVRVEPPAPRHENVPAARRGYEWAPGYWNWNGRKYVWTKGHWERARRGYVYRATTWEQADQGWRLNKGGWSRGDRDHDGVPNRADDHPNNPMRN